MDLKTKEIYLEVYEVLNLLGIEYINKLPKKLYKLIEDNRLTEKDDFYIKTEEINLQNIKKESLSMIALFHLNYWCESDVEREILEKIFIENEEKKELELKEKYNVDNLFKKKIKEENKEENEEENIEENVNNQNSIIKKKESIFVRFLNKIKSIFRRR